MCQIASVSRLVDLGDLGSALAAQAALGVLVELGVVGVLAGVQRGLEQRPTSWSRPTWGPA